MVGINQKYRAGRRSVSQERRDFSREDIGGNLGKGSWRFGHQYQGARKAVKSNKGERKELEGRF